MTIVVVHSPDDRSLDTHMLREPRGTPSPRPKTSDRALQGAKSHSEDPDPTLRAEIPNL